MSVEDYAKGWMISVLKFIHDPLHAKPTVNANPIQFERGIKPSTIGFSYSASKRFSIRR